MLYKKVNYSLIMYLLIFVISFNLTSCNNLSEKKDYQKKLEQSERLARNREEAKLLVQTTEISLKIIAISKKVKESDDNISSLALKLEKEHYEIYTYFNKIAKEKLILIPDEILKTQVKSLPKSIDTNSIQNYFKNIKTLLDQQIKLLSKLENITKDIDFKVMVVKTQTMLENQVVKIESTLLRSAKN